MIKTSSTKAKTEKKKKDEKKILMNEIAVKAEEKNLYGLVVLMNE